MPFRRSFVVDVSQPAVLSMIEPLRVFVAMVLPCKRIVTSPS